VDATASKSSAVLIWRRPKGGPSSVDQKCSKSKVSHCRYIMLSLTSRPATTVASLFSIRAPA